MTAPSPHASLSVQDVSRGYLSVVTMTSTRTVAVDDVDTGLSVSCVTDAAEGWAVGSAVVGEELGWSVGLALGLGDGCAVGEPVTGLAEGCPVGSAVVGEELGSSVVGEELGLGVGSFVGGD